MTTYPPSVTVLRVACPPRAMPMAIPFTPKDGSAVRAGILDTNLLRLIGKLIFHANRIYVGGASMGGDIAVGLVEQFPDAFAGALPACGAVAGWYDQIGYEADFR